MGVRQWPGGKGLDRGDRVESQLAHHGQPHPPRHGRPLADVYRSVRASDEPDTQGHLLKARPAIVKAVSTTAALKDVRAHAGSGESEELQPGGERCAEAYVASRALAEEVAKLKANEGKPIIAHGGASFARSLIAQGLVDQHDLFVHPVALGKALPVFSGLTVPRPLKLKSSTAFPGASVAQIYRPA
jgi:riboflavin biosynthesis pyrimidine reductase